MLKKLTPRHMDIIRRLLVAETPGEICLELDVSGSYLSVLQIDPLFNSKLVEMQDELDERFMEGRADAMQVLEAGAVESAKIVTQAATMGKIQNIDPETGSIDYKEVSVANQLKSAWDVLGHTGNKAPEKQIVGFFDAAELVKEAYRKKYKEGNEGTPASSMPSQSSSQPSEEEDDIKALEAPSAFDVIELSKVSEDEIAERAVISDVSEEEHL